MKQFGGRKRAYALQAGQGWTYRFGIDFTVKASEIRQGSGAAILEYTTKQGEEPPDHTHDSEDEMFYVLEGEITFRCGEERFEVKQGGFVFLPHGIEHGYRVQSMTPVRVLVLTAPARDAGVSGGWGGFVADMESGQGELIAKPDGER